MLKLFMFEGEGEPDGGWAKVLIAAESMDEARKILDSDSTYAMYVEEAREVLVPEKPGVTWSSLDGL